MIISKKSGIGALLVAGVLLAVIFAPPMSAGMDKTKSEKALEHISQKYGIPKEQLVITNEKEANFSLSNQKIQSVNILDSKGKELYHVDLDEAGNVTDIKAAKTLEYAKYREKYGKKEIELYEKLQKMNPDDTVEVGIWLSPIVDTSQPKSEISKKEYKEMLDAKRLAYEQKEKPVLDILKAKNINIRYASQYAPLIYAQVPVKLIADVENIPEVDGIYLSREFKPALDTIAQTARVQQVWNAGITGSGVKVAVVEKERIDFSNTNLTNGTVYNWSEPGMPHPTWVAGIIASRNNTYQGISYDVPRLLSANYGEGPVSQEESRVIAASEWAINESADILSNSYSNDTGDTGRALAGLDKYFDHIVWEHHKTVIAAAGNNGTGLAYVGTPGLGYNVVTVGGFEDMHDSDWSNDKIWAGSNYKDPISDYGDREKPEVVALATHNGLDTIMSTNSPRFEPDPIGPTNGAGTSWAAPQVAAEAALLMQADSSLKIWPETVKAIIMASAVHNIEGDSRLSEKDGAGGIDISSAYDPRITESSGMIAFTSDFPKHFTFSATAGQKVRVVITWDSHPDSNHPPVNDDLQSDLNLVVYDPSSAVVNISDSFDNSYEIVEFIASTTGTYDATVYARTFSGQYERLGFAKTAIDPSLSGWSFRKLKTITGSTSGAQTNYQMKLTVYNSAGTDTPGNIYLNGNAKSDFSDLRFTKSDGVTLLDYWIESYTPGESAVVWVEVDSIPASPGTSNIYIYYGNPSATSASNGIATFVFFDDFEDGDYTNNPIWTVETGTFSVQSEILDSKTSKRLYSSSQGSTIKSTSTLAQNGAWEWDYYNQGRDSYGNALQQGRNYFIYLNANNYAYAGAYSGYFLQVVIGGASVVRSDSGSNTIATGILHYKVTRSGNTWTFYVNDNQKYQGTISGLTSSALTKYYVSASGGNSGSYPNRIDNLRYRNYISPEPTWG